MTDLFKMSIKLENGAEFHCEQNTNYPLLGTSRETGGKKDRDELIDSIERIVKALNSTKQDK